MRIQYLESKALMNDLAKIFDSKLLKILSEPVRIDILKVLANNGSMDIGRITEQFSQDRSVISRHLSVMADVGIVIAQKKGRHKFYEVDGIFFLSQLEGMTEAIRMYFIECCPEMLKTKDNK